VSRSIGEDPIEGRLSLPNVTLLSINGRDPEKSIAAIRESRRQIDFAKSLLITNRKIEAPDIEVQTDPELNSLLDYNRICLLELYDRIETEFCLIVQPDGFVVHPRLWSPFFLEYDYIGAPWNHLRSMELIQLSGHQPGDLPSPLIGNGGFSLRSRKLLKTVASMNPNPNLQPEDYQISVMLRVALEDEGIRFAPLRLAQQFSLESHVDQFSVLGNHFGFHGRYAHFDNYLIRTGMDSTYRR
jgi:hypothetical protein